MKKLLFYRVINGMMLTFLCLGTPTFLRADVGGAQNEGRFNDPLEGLVSSSLYVKSAELASKFVPKEHEKGGEVTQLGEIQKRLQEIGKSIGVKQRPPSESEADYKKRMGNDIQAIDDKIEETLTNLAQCGKELFSSLSVRPYDENDPQRSGIIDVSRVIIAWETWMEMLRKGISALPLSLGVVVSGLRLLHGYAEMAVQALASHKLFQEALRNYREFEELLKKKEVFVKTELKEHSENAKALSSSLNKIHITNSNENGMNDYTIMLLECMNNAVKETSSILLARLGEDETLSREACLGRCTEEDKKFIEALSFRKTLPLMALDMGFSWVAEVKHRLNASMTSMAETLEEAGNKLNVDKQLSHDEQRTILRDVLSPSLYGRGSNGKGIIDALPQKIPLLYNLGLQSITKHIIERSGVYTRDKAYPVEKQKEIGKFLQATSTLLSTFLSIVSSSFDLIRTIATSKTDEEFEAYIKEKEKERAAAEEDREFQRTLDQEKKDEDLTQIKEMAKRHQILAQVSLPGAGLFALKDVTGKTFQILPKGVALYRGEFPALISLFLQTTLDFYFFKGLQEEKERHIVQSLLKDIPKTLAILKPLEVEKSTKEAHAQTGAKNEPLVQKESFLKRLLSGKLFSFPVKPSNDKEAQSKKRALDALPVPEQAKATPPLSRMKRLRNFVEREWEGVDEQGEPQPPLLSRLLGAKYTPEVQRKLKIDRYIEKYHTLVNYNVFQSPAIQSLVIFFVLREVSKVLGNYTSFWTPQEAKKFVIALAAWFLQKNHKLREEGDKWIGLFKDVFFPDDPSWKKAEEVFKAHSKIHDDLNTAEGARPFPISLILKKILYPDEPITGCVHGLIEQLGNAGKFYREVYLAETQPASARKTAAQLSQESSAFKKVLAEVAIRLATFILTVRFLEKQQAELWTGYIHTYHEPLRKLLAEYQECREKDDEASQTRLRVLREKIELFVHRGNSLVGKGLLSHFKGGQFITWLRMMMVSSIKAGLLVTTALALPHMLFAAYHMMAWVYKRRKGL